MRNILWLLCILWMFGCNQSETTSERRATQLPMNERDTTQTERFVETDISILDTVSTNILKPDTSELERSLISQGLVNIQTISPNIQVDLKYSTTDNFLEKDVYGTLNSCYLQQEVADMLAQAVWQESIVVRFWI